MEREQFTLSVEQKKALFASTNERSDNILHKFLLGNFVLGILLAFVYDTWLVAIAVGGMSLIAYYGTKKLLPESNLYQYVGSAVLAIFMAQYIYQMHGLFEMHFFAFVACTLMITYSNWRLQLPLFVIIVVHHAAFAYMQFVGVEGIYFTQLPYMDLTTFLIHAGLAGLIIFICGLWGYFSEKKIINDGIRALRAEFVLSENLKIAHTIKEGDYDSEIVNKSKDPLSEALLEMRQFLKDKVEREAAEKYSSQGVAQVSRLLADINTLGKEIGWEKYIEKILNLLSTHLNARQGTFFMLNESEEEPMLQLLAGYAYEKRKFIKNKIPFGEGLIGQVALEQKYIIVKDLPEEYFLISSSLGSAHPKEVLAWPLIADQKLVGVVEFASFENFEEKHFHFLEEASFRIASTLANAEAQEKTRRLLEESEALKVSLEENNQKLEAQADQLKESEQALRQQQESLLEANTELEAQTQELEVQKKALIEQNEEIESARAELIQKAEELEASNTYKSEFLANMSHELRTPLNSILILANILADNKGERLNDKDVEHARVIHRAGSDLLTLINDILDLSKIEAGKLDLLMEAVGFEEVAKDMEMMFEHVAEKKGIHFEIEISEKLPTNFESDRVRLEQIIKNLLSNACKFTSKEGTVKLGIELADTSLKFKNENLNDAEQIVEFAVSDTGIGIPKEKQAKIFEAFSQADGSTSRKYGGTGLGLSICVQLSHLLGGEVQLVSEENKGSTFSLYLPLNAISGDQHSRNEESLFKPHIPQTKNTDRSNSTILIVEDQELQNKALGQLLNRHNYHYSQTFNGQDTLTLLAEERKVDCVILDYNLPDMTGLDVLKEIRQMEGFHQIPVIIHTAEDLSLDIQQEINQYTRTIISKATQSSRRLIDEINLQLGYDDEEVEVVEKKPKARKSSKATKPKAPKAKKSVAVPANSSFLKEKNVFLVDDDMRNIFAISAIMESNSIEVQTALNGKEALEKLEDGLEPDIILMDIMMPEMDGFEAIQRIRKMEKFQATPIIAITAKAMAEDRQNCLDAGADEYLSKPLDTELLLQRMEDLLKNT